MSGIKKITDEVKSAVAKSVEPMKNLTTQAKDMASKSASSVSQMKAQMKGYSNSIQETAKQQEYLKSKIEDLKYLLSQADMGFEVGDTLKIEADIEKLENRLKKLQNQGRNTGEENSSAFDKIKAKIKSAGTHIASLGSKFKATLSSSKGLGKSFTSTFNNGIKSIKRFAMGLLSVRTAVSMVSKAMQSYLSYDTQLSNSIQNCWNVLGSLLAPILEFVISLFSKAVSYVNAFVEALTGINLVARANKKALDSQAKSTKKLSDTQSSLDEFHTVSTDTGSGNDNKPITVEPVDMDKLDFLLDCISRIIIAIGSVWEFLKPIIDTIIDVIMNVLEPVIDGLCGIIGSIIDALSGVMDFITGVFTGDWSKAWEGLKTFLGGIIDAVASLFTGLFNTIGAIFKGAWDIIVSIWSVVSTWFNNAVIKPLANLFNGIWNTMKNGAQNAWNGIKNIFSSVATFFKNIFGNAWNGVKNIFSSGGRIFSGIKDGIFNAFRSVVNTLIAGINKVVSIPFNAINGALKTVRDISFLGIEPFKGLIKLVNVPQIPSLETGGVLDKETIVRVAEYSNARSNPEIVSPRDMMKETMKEALEESNMKNTSQKVDVNITGKLTADGDDLVYVYDKNKKDKGYDGGKNPSFAY